MLGDLRDSSSVESGALELSVATVRGIPQNLLFDFLYNALGVPITAGVLYSSFGLVLSPIIAALVMSFYSVSVVGHGT